jgi:hypothetical protein
MSATQSAMSQHGNMWMVQLPAAGQNLPARKHWYHSIGITAVRMNSIPIKKCPDAACAPSGAQAIQALLNPYPTLPCKADLSLPPTLVTARRQFKPSLTPLPPHPSNQALPQGVCQLLSSCLALPTAGRPPRRLRSHLQWSHMLSRRRASTAGSPPHSLPLAWGRPWWSR